MCQKEKKKTLKSNINIYSKIGFSGTSCANNVILLKLLHYLILEGGKNAYFHAVCQTCVGSFCSAAARRTEEGRGTFLETLQ